jgi:DNA primase
MDVKKLLVKKNIQFKSQGRDYVVKCLNPDHEDSNPSMKIDKISGLFNCLSCGFGGDIFKYFKINKDKFIDIKVNNLLELISSFKKKTLHIPTDAAYIKEDFRGISSKTLRSFGAFTSDSMRKMEGRIVFPIWDIHGDIVAFQGRYLYSNLEPRYDIEPAHTTLPLYPTRIKPIDNSMILVEGIFDMLNLWDKGLTNTVTTWGTAFGTVKTKPKKTNNLERLMQYKFLGVDIIYIMYDGDDAGRKAAKNLKEYIDEKFNVVIINLEDGKDPGKLTASEINKIKEEYYA